MFLGVNVHDFGSPCQSVTKSGGLENAKYSDISDDDFETKDVQENMMLR